MQNLRYSLKKQLISINIAKKYNCIRPHAVYITVIFKKLLMIKLLTTLATLFFLFFTATIQATNVPPDVFVDAALDGCTKHASKKYCLCEAQIRYDNLSDKEKGLMIIILEIEASSSNLDLKELYKSSTKKYDPDGNIQKGITSKKEKIEKEIYENCKK